MPRNKKLLNVHSEVKCPFCLETIVLRNFERHCVRKHKGYDPERVRRAYEALRNNEAIQDTRQRSIMTMLSGTKACPDDSMNGKTKRTTPDEDSSSNKLRFPKSNGTHNGDNLSDVLAASTLELDFISRPSTLSALEQSCEGPKEDTLSQPFQDPEISNSDCQSLSECDGSLPSLINAQKSSEHFDDANLSTRSESEDSADWSMAFENDSALLNEEYSENDSPIRMEENAEISVQTPEYETEETLPTASEESFTDWCSDNVYTFPRGASQVLYLKEKCQPEQKTKSRDKQYTRHVSRNWWEGKYRKLWLRVEPRGLVCMVCMKFGRVRPQSQNAWTSKPMDNLRKAISKIEEHESSSEHIYAVDTYMQRKTKPSVYESLVNASASIKDENKEYLSRLVRSFLYLVEEDIPVTSKFAKQVYHEMRNGNELMKKVHSRLPDNAKYTSHTFVKELFDATRHCMQNMIQEKLADVNCISIAADEAQDISSSENIAVFSRFIDKTDIKEYMLGLASVKRQDGESIAEEIIKVMNNYEIKEVVSQSYDGGSNMKHVVTKIIQAGLHPHAIYIHCSSHLVNLAINDAVRENVLLKQVSDFARDIYKYFYPKKGGGSVRRQALEHAFQAMSWTFKKPLKQCATRWDSLFESVMRITEIYVPLLISLETLSLECPVAKSYSDLMRQKDFMLGCFFIPQLLETLVCMNKFFQSAHSHFTKLNDIFASSIQDINLTWQYPSWITYEKTIKLLEDSKNNMAYMSTASSTRSKISGPNHFLEDFADTFVQLFGKSLFSQLSSCESVGKGQAMFLHLCKFLCNVSSNEADAKDVTEMYIEACNQTFTERSQPETFRKKRQRTRTNLVSKVKDLDATIQTNIRKELPKGLLNLKKQLSTGSSFKDLEPNISKVVVDMVENLKLCALKLIEEEFKQKLGLQVKENLITSLEERLCDETRLLLGNADVLEPCSILGTSDPRDSLPKLRSLLDYYGKSQTSTYITKSGKQYETHSQPLVNYEKCLRQWPLLHGEIRRKVNEVTDGAVPTLLELYPHLLDQEMRFPDIMELVKIVLTWFMGTASVERSFSIMKRIKTRLRNCLSLRHLECVMMWNINKMEATDEIIEDIVQYWYRKKARNIVI